MLTAENVIQLGTIDTSPEPFVREVRGALGSIDDVLKAEFGSEVSMEHELIGIATMYFRVRRPVGYGYLSSSIEHNRHREIIWTSVVVSAFQAAGLNPLVVPIDTFDQYSPDKVGILDKMQVYNYGVQGITDYDPRHILVLSGFTESLLYTQQTLLDVPRQEHAGLSIRGYDQIGKRVQKFKKDVLPELLSNSGDIQTVIETVAKQGTGDSDEQKRDDAKLLITTACLSGQSNGWQMLWDLRPSYIVAPQSFHRAMLRLNYSGVHGGFDYQYRASQYGANDDPIFDVVDDKVLTRVDFENRFKHIPWVKGGISQEEFAGRVGPLLEKFCKI